ncbi:TadE/TadG family type IV pilus assembly protein [Aquamicrobium terrae]|uniref:TadE-like domain-containing protein n=1 Tax=Aquamicrobium terrae TaxID=1324945 RepID=A0ABV2N1T9_9HYPH
MGSGSNNSGAGGKPRTGLLSRFRRDASGSVAIEFSMLILPFALLTFAILESCISFAGKQVLANAADDVARQFRTGQLRAPATPPEREALKEEIKGQICRRLEIIVTKECPGLLIDLRSFDKFSDAAQYGFVIDEDKIVLTPGNIQEKDFAIDPGTTMSKNMLRVFYKWPVITDFMSKYMANIKGGKTLHFATMTWQNEPF